MASLSRLRPAAHCPTVLTPVLSVRLHMPRTAVSKLSTAHPSSPSAWCREAAMSSPWLSEDPEGQGGAYILTPI